MKKIRILMVLGNTEIGGAQAFVLNLLRKMDLKRFQVDFAVSSVDGGDGIAETLKSMGCRIYILPYFKVYNYLTFVKQWKEFLSAHRYHIVHGHSTNSASVYLKIAKKAGCVTIAHSHSAGYRGNQVVQIVKKCFAKGVRKEADYWFACSDKAAERLFGEKYNKYKNYYYIPNAINIENYQYDAAKAKALRKQLGIKDNGLVCGHVGSFTQPKNHEFLLSIFAEVLRKYPNAKLVCCGAGKLLPRVREKAIAMGIANSVIFAGVVKNVNEYLMTMDVMVFPSFFEGLPIAVVEAQATGLPVVISDVITEEVDVTKLVHRHSLSASAEEWARAVWAQSPVNRKAYYEIIANSRFTMNTCAKFVSSLYEDMAEKLSAKNEQA